MNRVRGRLVLRTVVTDERPTMGPARARGIVPLIAAALGAGAIRAGLGIITGNQKKQRNKGYIEDSYRTANQRLGFEQRGVQQGTEESLNARGIVNYGPSPIREAMTGGLIGVPTRTPHDLGQQVQSDLQGQFQLEQHDLDAQRKRALEENKAEYTNTILGSIAAGAQTAGSIASMGGGGAAGGAAGAAGGASPSVSPAPSASPIHGAMGVDSPIPGAFGIDPVNPWGLGGNKGTTLGVGQSNAEFHVG